MKNDENPIGNFLNNLPGRLREAREGGRKKRNWETESGNAEQTEQKKISDFDYEKTLHNINLKIGKFSSEASSKITEQMVKLNDKLNYGETSSYNVPETDRAAENTGARFSEASMTEEERVQRAVTQLAHNLEGLTAQKAEQEAKAEEEFGKTDKPTNVYDIFEYRQAKNNTAGNEQKYSSTSSGNGMLSDSTASSRVDDEEKTAGLSTGDVLSGLSSSFHELQSRVWNEQNKQRFNDVKNSAGSLLAEYKEKAERRILGDVYDEVDSVNVSEKIREVKVLGFDDVVSGAILLEALEEQALFHGSSYAVVKDADNEHNVPLLTLLTARSKGYEVFNLELRDAGADEASMVRVEKGIERLDAFVKSSSDSETLAVFDVRGSEQRIIEKLSSRTVSKAVFLTNSTLSNEELSELLNTDLIVVN